MYDSLGDRCRSTSPSRPPRAATPGHAGHGDRCGLSRSGRRRRRWSSGPTASCRRSTAPPSGPDRPPSPSPTSRATTPGPGERADIDFPPVGSQSAVTQFADDQTMEVTSQDGNAAGTLESYSIGSDGVDHRELLERDSQALGTIALAQFANPERVGRRRADTTSPLRSRRARPQLGSPGTNGLGTLQGGAVEGSNVDLATELTDLIEAQTAYQANTKVVDTTSTACSRWCRCRSDPRRAAAFVSTDPQFWPACGPLQRQWTDALLGTEPRDRP